MTHFTANIHTAWTASDGIQMLVVGRFEAVVEENPDYTEWELFHRGSRIAGDFVNDPKEGRAAVEAALCDELGLPINRDA